ncbi:MAG: hypothetical protein LBN12_04845 [Clostridiales Family XIII bacterium]|jgi:uncharacterized membrane protein YdfJ with MMPL/SSD domain|nr:hypothetical protein [Clostridiales Family XIII bacterium]
MRIVNSEKSRARVDLITSIQNDMTLLAGIEKKVDEALTSLQNGLAGFPSGIDQNVSGILQRTKSHIADIRRALKLAGDTSRELDVMEEAGD